MNKDKKRKLRKNGETCLEETMFIAWYDLDYEAHVVLSFYLVESWLAATTTIYIFINFVTLTGQVLAFSFRSRDGPVRWVFQ